MKNVNLKSFRLVQIGIHHRTEGFTLLEVLIAVLVLAIGLLGFASLQLTSVNNNLDARFQSQATILAQDLASRMHINREYINWDVRIPRRQIAGADTNESKVGDQNVYVTPAANLRTGFTCGATPAAQTGGGATVPAQVCNNLGQANPAAPLAENACDQQQMAAFDVWQVCSQVNEVLPEGRLHVRCQDKAPIVIAGVINPRNNPFNNTHRYFAADTTPSTLITGADPVGLTDACHPGSLYTVYVSWRRSIVRADSGETGAVTTDANYRCNIDLGFSALTGDDNRDCVAIDVVP